MKSFKIAEDIYKIAEQEISGFEEWEFAPGIVVRVRVADPEDGLCIRALEHVEEGAA